MPSRHRSPLVEWTNTICLIEDCEASAEKRGWCGTHYQRWRKHGDPTYRAYRPVEERFLVKVGKTDSCWEWTGAQFANGYGAFQVNGKTVRAHRFAWELAHGPIPEGIRVLHHCDNRLCCRPDHLFLGTDADNAADKIAKGRDRRPARPPRKTHCPQGHSYDEANTAWYRDWYYCRTCKRARSAAGYQRKKARIS